MMANDHPTDMDKITARRVESWELELSERVASATVHNRHRGLQRFFSWYAGQLEDDDDSWRNPMGKMKPPKMERCAPRVLMVDEMRAVLAACAGKGFEERRDDGLIRMFFKRVRVEPSSGDCATPPPHCRA